MHFVKNEIPLYELEVERKMSSSVSWKISLPEVKVITKFIITTRDIRKFSLLFTQRVISLNRYFGVLMANLCVSRYLF